MNEKNVLEAASRAEKLVEKIDVNYRYNAFQVVFSKILDELEANSQIPPTGKPKTAEPPRNKSIENKVGVVLSAPIDFSKYYDVIRNGDWAERALAILQILDEELGIESITAPELAEIIEKKLRLAHVYPSNISRALSGAGSYFIRSKQGKTYEYMISIEGKEHLEEISRQ